MSRPWPLAAAIAAFGIGVGGYARAGGSLTGGYWVSGLLILLGAYGIALNIHRMLERKP